VVSSNKMGRGGRSGTLGVSTSGLHNTVFNVNKSAKACHDGDGGCMADHLSRYHAATTLGGINPIPLHRHKKRKERIDSIVVPM
jgi:hypothetical protein